MAQITLTLDIDDDFIKRVRAEHAENDGDWSEELWDEAQTAVIDEVRATFSPADLLEDGA